LDSDYFKERRGYLFFIGLTISLSLLATGIILIIKSSYIIGGALLALSIILFSLMARYYKKKKQANRYEESSAGVFDCIDCADVFKKSDCDCSPDCSSW